MAARTEDRFANIAAIGVTQTAANSTNFTQMLTGISLGEGRGIIIDQIDYMPINQAIDELLIAADQIRFGIFSSDSITDFEDITQRRILHSAYLKAAVSGTPASWNVIKMPLVHQFFPPMIFAAPRLYAGVASAGFTAAITVYFRIYFRYVTLSPQEYIELAEAFVLI